MARSRREFLSGTAVLLGVAASRAAAAADAGASADAGAAAAAKPPAAAPGAAPLAAASPPAFGANPASGPAVDASTFGEAAKIAWVDLSDAERAQAAGSWRVSMAGLHERRSGPRKVELESSVGPGSLWHPAPLAGAHGVAPKHAQPGKVTRSKALANDPLPAHDEDIAYAPVHRLSRWIESRKLSSERLTHIYLERLARFQPQLNCAITITSELAMAQAQRADQELAHGKYRGPLHGIPWGAKDLLDTKDIPTTYGAETFRARIPKSDAVVVQRLDEAGAVLVAKLSLGALALNDVWFGGRTNNPWCLEEGSSGSSAGPGAATAAGLVGFAIGSETGGSIISPSMRCGVSGLRPTFGRVARTGAMTLCWSLDKLGPMARGVEDTLLVLKAISGPDAGDPYSVPSTLDFDAAASAKIAGLRVGVFPKWMKEDPATAVDRTALEQLRALGLKPVEVALPDWPYDDLQLILFAEAAAAFETETLSHALDALKMQVPDAWPNLFRQSRFLSAVDFVQADRLRRKVALEMARLFEQVDLLLVPSLRDEMLTITNFTGHPSLTLRAGFIEIDRARSDWAPDPAAPLPTFSPPRRVPHGVTLIGRLFDEGTIGQVGLALEKVCAVADARPAGF